MKQRQVLILVLFSLIVILFTSLMIYKYRNSDSKSQSERLNETQTNIEKNAKALGATDEEIKQLKENISEQAKICAYGKPPCLSDDYIIDDNGCCVLKPDKVLSETEKKLLIANTIAKELAMSLIIDELLELALKAGLKGIELGAKLAAKVGLISIKASTKIGLATAKMAKALSSPWLIGFEIGSALLDIFDPAGYNLYQSNDTQRKLLKAYAVGMEKNCLENNLPYPMIVPLSYVFPTTAAGASETLANEFMTDAFTKMSEKDPEALGRILEASFDNTKEIPEADSELFGDILSETMNSDPKKRDDILYEYFQENTPSSQKKYIKRYPTLSTKEVQGVSLSEEGVIYYNNLNRNKWINNEENAPLVALFTDQYYILDKSNPGKASDPNTLVKNLIGTDGNIIEAPLAFPFGAAFANCEGTLQGGLIPGAKPSVTPYQFGVRFNNKNGTCKMTKNWCTRMGLNYVSSGDTNCKSSPGQKVAEYILGTTITRGASQVINTLKDSYGRGVGYIPKCAEGQERKGAFCYDKCRSGYRSSALECEGSCPSGSTNTGLTCLQSTHAYIPPQASKNPFSEGFYCSKDCKSGYYEKLKAGCAHTCVKPCKDGFKRRSNAAGSAFCDKPRPRYSRAGNPKEAKTCRGKDDLDGALCYPACKPGFYGVGPVCYPCTGLESGKKDKLACRQNPPEISSSDAYAQEFTLEEPSSTKSATYSIIRGKMPKDSAKISLNHIEGYDRAKDIRIYRQGSKKITRMFGGDKNTVMSECKKICTNDDLCKGYWVIGNESYEQNCMNFVSFGGIQPVDCVNGKRTIPSEYSCNHLSSTSTTNLENIDNAITSIQDSNGNFTTGNINRTWVLYKKN